ncbi:hypothetical protein ACLKA6_011646 [Drosophila palustris]
MLPGVVARPENVAWKTHCVLRIFPCVLGQANNPPQFRNQVADYLLSLLSLSLLLEPLKLRRRRSFKDKSARPSIVRRAASSYQPAARPRILSFFGYCARNKGKQRRQRSGQNGASKEKRESWQRDEAALN